MVTKLQKWGNGKGIRFAKHLLQEVQIEVGDEVEVTVENGVIMVRPSKRRSKRYSLRKLVAKMPKAKRRLKEEWGGPSGKEAW